MIEIKNYINGERVAPKNGQYLDNYEPATGKIYSRLPDSDALDVVHAVKAAQEAFQGWSATPAKERAKILNKIADELEVRLDEFAMAECRDVGKPITLAKTAEIPRAIFNFRFFAAQILTQKEMAADMDGQGFNYVLRQPLGVAGLISPWNLPLYLLTWKLAPALAFGNTAVCKPSEVTPMTAYLLIEVLEKAGLPKGVCNIIFGKGEKAGAALVNHPGVPLISFTGGTETGAIIQQAAAPKFKKVSLELGGKNANIIFNDADLKKALPTSIRASFNNSGQICLCGSRLLVQEDIYTEFMTEFRKLTSEIIVGDPTSESTVMGPVVSLEQKEKVMKAVELAKKERGVVTFGGETPTMTGDLRNGYFYKPTIIEDLTNCSELWQEEIFGPVVTVQKFKYAHEAVKWANTSSFGLSASLWTKDLSRAHKSAAQINAGTVWINTWMQRDLRVPFGGMKQSGIGREGGEFSLDFYTEAKNICVSL
jgi:aminomuconate-semialdehyde/2-hydroxymuconate-6-semialdehyde dehydrogenase